MTDRRRRGITYGVLALLVLLVVGGFFGIRHIENTLTDDSEAWLSANGYPNVDVDAKGRGIVLSGEAPAGTQLDVLSDDLESNLVHQHDHWWSFNDDPGVRYVDTGAVAVAAAPVPTPEPVATGITTVEADVDGDSVILSGEVLTEGHRQELVAAAVDEFGESNVTDNLTVTDLEPEIAGVDQRVSALAALVPTLHNRVSGRATLNATELTITGIAANEEARGDVEGFAGSLDGVDAMVDLEVVAEPEPEPEPTPVPEAVVADLDLTGVQFHTGTADLTDEAKAVLDEVAVELEEFPDVKIKVEGHTDSQGDPESNMALSQARAEAVVGYLEQNGVAEGRLTAEGFGETDPIADNNTQEGRAQNRRVELSVMEGN